MLEDDVAKCVICDEKIPWHETWRDGKQVLVCKHCLEEAQMRDIMRRRRSHRSKMKPSEMDWEYDE